MSRIRLKQNVNIGKVVFVVEGPKTEIYILKKILQNLFGYELVVKRNNHQDVEIYKSSKNNYSKIYIINARNSELTHIKPNDSYIEDLLNDMIENYNLSLDNAAIYYIYDRDPLNNLDKKLIKDLINIYSNARDNGIERQGMLLLSYPAFESFTVSNFHTSTYLLEYKLGKDVKQFSNECLYNHSNIIDDTLIHATNELLLAIKELNIKDYDLDNMSNYNLSLFDLQEDKYSKVTKYNLISTFLLFMIDLGLIVLE